MLAEESDCWLCGRVIDPRVVYPDPWSGSVDHVVPLSRGGDPLARGNCRAAHLRCNQRRNNRGRAHESV